MSFFVFIVVVGKDKTGSKNGGMEGFY